MKFDVACAARQRKHWCAHAPARPPRLALTYSLLCIAAAGVLGGCASSSEQQASTSDTRLSRPARAKFTTAEYGARVIAPGAPVPKGGGTYKLGQPYQMGGRWYVPRVEPGYAAQGVASWYGDDFHGRKTANGEIYDMHALTAAHPTLPLPSYVWVTNEANGRTLLVRVNDRGPYARDRIIDLSRTAARELGYENNGTARVRVRYAGPAPLNGNEARERQVLAEAPWRRGGSRLAEAPAPQHPSAASRPRDQYAHPSQVAYAPPSSSARQPVASAAPASRSAYSEPARQPLYPEPSYPEPAYAETRRAPVAPPANGYAGRDDYAALKAQGRLPAEPPPPEQQQPYRAPAVTAAKPPAEMQAMNQPVSDEPAQPAAAWSVSGYRQSIAGQRRSLGGP